MHQKIESKYDDLAYVMAKAESSISAPVKGVGKRSFISATLRDKSIGIELFVENVVSIVPGDPGLGFTEDDLTLFRGVAIYKISRGEDLSGPRLHGEIMSLDVFFDRHVADERSKSIFEACMIRLEDEAKVKEGFWESVNEIWKEREVGRSGLYNKGLH